MDINTMTMTAPAMTAAPTTGMSGYRSAPRGASCVRATGASWIARDRHAGLPVLAATAGVIVATDAVVKGAFPGPDAWSPPRD